MIKRKSKPKVEKVKQKEVEPEIVAVSVEPKVEAKVEVQPEVKIDYVVVTKGVKQYKKFTRLDGTTYLEGPIN